MTTIETPVRYRRTKAGEWVAYGPAEMLTAGHAVAIHKADGTTEGRTIARVGRRFTADGQEMVYGYLEPRTARQVQDAHWARRTGTGHTRGCSTAVGGPCDCDD